MTRDTAWSALACGLCMLIPLPWVDEYAQRRVLRRLFANLGAAQGVELGPAGLDRLTEDRSSMLVGCLAATVKWPLKKLFRTILYFLTLKDVLDAATRAAHRAEMVEEALRRGLLPARAEEVRTAMDDVLGRVRASPVSRTLWLQDRPALDLPPVEHHEGKLLRWFQRLGGGGVLLPAFRERLEKLA